MPEAFAAAMTVDAHARPQAGVADSASAATWTVLCVDDEPNILSALRRLFRGTGYRVVTAESGAQALGLLESEPVNLIISDMRMPHMDGAQLLERVHAGWPQVTRLLLTGYADMGSTIAAINQGQITRYLTKPWRDEEVLLTVREAFERHELEAEKKRLQALAHRQNEELKQLNATLEDKVARRTEELSLAHDKLKKNYFNSIKTFSNLIELRGGQLVGHARRVADLCRRTAKALAMEDNDVKDVFIAALLHDIGQIGLSDLLLTKPVPKMNREDLVLYQKHPVLGEQALLGLDDMQRVGALIRSHHERHDGCGFPDGLKENNILLGARILSIADTYDDLQTGHLGAKGLTPSEARTVMVRGRGSQFDPHVLDVFLGLFASPAAPTHKPLSLRTDELKPGMVLARDFLSTEGVMLLAADHVLTADLIARIRTFEQRSGLSLLLAIRHPQESKA